MYESPIETYVGNWQLQVMKQQEDAIYIAIQKCGINVDKDELIKALNYDREQYSKGYVDAIKEFVNYLKDNSFLYDLDDLAEDFLRGINT